MNTDIPELHAIKLDDQSMNIEELSMSALTQEINQSKRPNSLLVKMMNALEKKRQKKGLGWSRSWNKYGLNVFRTHTTDEDSRSQYINPVRPYLEAILDTVEEPYASFITSLMDDPKLMVFTFYHNNDSEGNQFEGLTLSFGRKLENDRSKRDRLDIILEDKRENGAVDGKIDRVRIYICPWETHQNKNFHLFELTTLDNEQQESSQKIYTHALDYYTAWKSLDERQWSHWSTRFIDYFGPRSFIPHGSSFT